ncbi:Malarial early transcribed membrane protein (ETRAMP), putative [Plasmodium ovale]|uniref:Malarial early transcribed membrane protein (ETRAMP), putative n=1 Tax=Plasmodium ovale TaxID=36330 RepID=A0A1C3KTB5_PLAOA|nr:Malarial early transcribed membrane protein (ETRAMP), putative [Plasmodium ovale]
MRIINVFAFFFILLTINLLEPCACLNISSRYIKNKLRTVQENIKQKKKNKKLIIGSVALGLTILAASALGIGFYMHKREKKGIQELPSKHNTLKEDEEIKGFSTKIVGDIIAEAKKKVTDFFSNRNMEHQKLNRAVFASTNEEMGKGVHETAAEEEMGKGVHETAAEEEMGKGVHETAAEEEMGKAVHETAVEEEMGKAVHATAVEEEMGKAVPATAVEEEMRKAVHETAAEEEMRKAVHETAAEEEMRKAVHETAAEEEMRKAVHATAAHKKMRKAIHATAMEKAVHATTDKEINKTASSSPAEKKSDRTVSPVEKKKNVTNSSTCKPRRRGAISVNAENFPFTRNDDVSKNNENVFSIKNFFNVYKEIKKMLE